MSGAPIPVSILTGFLGSGKTTLLNRLLKHPDLKDTAVIINEFGDVSIDHLLVEQARDGIIELSDGCVCCTVRGDLVDTLADLIDRVQTGKLPALSRVVVETTGLADPVPVLQSVMGHPALVQAFRLDGVVTLVDAVNGGANLDGHVEAVRQVAVADRIVLTKTDLVDATFTLAGLQARLAAINPNARIHDGRDADASLPSLFANGLYDPKTRSADVRRWLGEAAAQAKAHDRHHDHDHADGHGHDHHGHAHDHRIRTFSLVHPGPVPYSAIEMFLDLLLSVHGDRLLRMKGVVELAEDGARPLVIHGVRKLLHPPVRLPAWPDEGRGTRLVLIVQDMPEDYVRRLFAILTDRPAVDTPDRAALADNPLGIPGFMR
jgi:G3E family GTPase